IFAYKNNLNYAQRQQSLAMEDIIYKSGFFAEAFAIESEPYKNRVEEVNLPEDIVEISDTFSFPFHTSGIMRKGQVYTIHTIPIKKEPIRSEERRVGKERRSQRWREQEKEKRQIKRYGCR